MLIENMQMSMTSHKILTSLKGMKCLHDEFSAFKSGLVEPAKL